ncbi:hypothetical protein YC2023_118092 [Brassica napus]
MNRMKRKHQPRFEDDGHRLRSQSISKQRMDHSQRKDVPLSTVFRRLMSIIRGSCSSHVTFQRENTPNTKIPVTSTSHTTFDSGISNTSYIEHDCSIDDPENEGPDVTNQTAPNSSAGNSATATSAAASSVAANSVAANSALGNSAMETGGNILKETVEIKKNEIKDFFDCR